MSEEALKFKKNNPELNYTQMTMGELSKLPVHNGLLNFKITNTSFYILNILNDDSSAIKFFWKNKHDEESLDLWYDISKEKGTFIDVGAHTGLYTLTSLKSNLQNNVIAFEPYFMNMARLITNLRINGINQNVSTIIGAVSDFDGKAKFNIDTNNSYLSKGGKLNQTGFDTNVFKLDSLYLNKLQLPLNGIKIDTEGEDFKVLKGATKLIINYRPKIIVEVREQNKIDINNFFNENNYRLYDVLDLSTQINLTDYSINNISNIFADPI